MRLLIILILLLYSPYLYLMDVPRAAAVVASAKQREALFEYICKGKEKSFERKLDSEKIPVGTCDEHGSSLLHVASAAAQPKIVRILLDRGADVHAISEYSGAPPLYEAITCNPEAPKVVELLLAHGADAFFVSKHYKQNPVFLAAVGGYVLLVRLLLTKSRYKIEHKVPAGVTFEKAVQDITDARIAMGKKLIGLKDYKEFTALVYITIDLEVLPKKPNLQDFEIERIKGFREVIPLLNVELFEQNFGKEIQDDVRKILIESQKKHK